MHEVLAAFVAGAPVARQLLARGEEVNTDDRNPVEFAFARMVSGTSAFDVERLRAEAAALGADRPSVDGPVDWDRVARHRVEIYTLANDTAPVAPQASEADRRRAEAHALYARGRVTEALEAFRKQPRPASGLVETALFAEGLAERGELEATPYIATLGAAVPPEADAAAARLAYRRGRLDLAVASLQSAFTRYRSDPWPHQSPMSRALALAREIAAAHPSAAPVLLDALARPFAVRALEQERNVSRVAIARAAGLWDRCRDALDPLEPFVPWWPDILRYRAECYERRRDGRARRAAAELDEFVGAQPSPVPAPARPSAVP